MLVSIWNYEEAFTHCVAVEGQLNISDSDILYGFDSNKARERRNSEAVLQGQVML